MGEDEGVDLRVELSGIELKNPVLVCSGTFGNAREFSEWLDLEELGGIITKAVTLEPCHGNPPPRLWETPCGMLNSIGLENRGLRKFLEDDLPWLSGFRVPLWVNVAGFTMEEYVRVAGEISRSGMADAVELNISCPNVARGGMHFSQRPEEAARLVARVREAVDIPLYVKLPPLVPDMEEMARSMRKAGADGLSLINTVPGMAVDVETARPRLGSSRGGLSGPAIHPIAVLKVWEAAGAVDLPIIGMGGIWSWRDAVEMLLVGAHAVAVGTLNFERPTAALDIVRGIRSYMEARGYRRVSEMVGLTRRLLEDGDACQE